ncbi:PAS domain S-box protein [Xanthobacter autotrophicus]|uniref:PAS domain S-box protein n=1 Tax=Xanthobacter autotrophicus TaxID=280 RepID=UPI0024A6CCA0|nr:PAS domain S-box protein [Xanthobacter autotrophicus]MDI4656788.1 PAS domain S-box protein [Xanthobacter autotrophicus]
MTSPLDTQESAPDGGDNASLVRLSDLGLFTALFQSIPGRAVLLDSGGVCRFANQEFIDFIGRGRDEVIDRPVQDFLEPVVFASYAPLMERVFGGELVRRVAWVDYGRLGKRYLEEVISPYRVDLTGPVVGCFGVGRDLTDLKHQEMEIVRRTQAQMEAEAYHAAIVGTALDGIVVVDEDGTVVDFNPAAEQIFGYRKEEAIGRSIAELVVPPEFRAAHAAGMRSYLASGITRVIGQRLELPALLADGTRIPIELAITDVTRGERRLFAAHMRDLRATKRAEEEIKRQRNALHQKEKLAALGSLLAGVAHELNNPLSVVTGQTMLLREQVLKEANVRSGGLPSLEKVIQRCDRIETAAHRCARIVRSFLDMARQREAERRATNLADVAREAVELLGYNMRASGVRVSLAIEPGLPRLMLDAGQIHQVLLNLLVNAQQALEETAGERRVTVSVASDTDRGAILIKVADNGPGIAENIRSRIFDPFFTTKPQGVGTGIGLAVSRGLIEAHGGTLELGTGPDGGALFTIQLPLEEVAAEAPPPGPQEDAQGAGVYLGSVLIVDDEPDIAGLLAEIAEGIGYAAVVAHSGREAQALLARAEPAARPADIVGILCDIRMPDGDGPSLYNWLLSHRPDLSTRIGFISGDTLGPSAGRFLARSGCPLIEKPFTPTDVRAFLGALIGDAAPPPETTETRRTES